MTRPVLPRPALPTELSQPPEERWTSVVERSGLLFSEVVPDGGSVTMFGGDNVDVVVSARLLLLLSRWARSK